MKKLKETMEWRVNTENEAISLIESIREKQTSENYIVAKANYTYKTKKSKGEIIAEAYIVTATLVFGEIWEDLV